MLVQTAACRPIFAAYAAQRAARLRRCCQSECARRHMPAVTEVCSVSPPAPPGHRCCRCQKRRYEKHSFALPVYGYATMPYAESYSFNNVSLAHAHRHHQVRVGAEQVQVWSSGHNAIATVSRHRVNAARPPRYLSRHNTPVCSRQPVLPCPLPARHRNRRQRPE